MNPIGVPKDPRNAFKVNNYLQIVRREWTVGHGRTLSLCYFQDDNNSKLHNKPDSSRPDPPKATVKSVEEWVPKAVSHAKQEEPLSKAI